ncbi:MAG: hypothetical protein ACM3ZU_02200 [Bacteroidota bacterium]
MGRRSLAINPGFPHRFLSPREAQHKRWGGNGTGNETAIGYDRH